MVTFLLWLSGGSRGKIVLHRALFNPDSLTLPPHERLSKRNIFCHEKFRRALSGHKTLARITGKECRMNRNVAIALVIAILAAGGYWYYSGQQQAAMETGEAASSAAAAVTEAASTAAAATTEAASTAAAATTEAASTAAAATTEAASTAAAATTEAASTAAAATTEAAAPFDADALTAKVDASTLDDATKTTLKAAIAAAKANPALVQAAMDQVSKALGM
jgi:hypothetical protein